VFQLKFFSLLSEVVDIYWSKIAVLEASVNLWVVLLFNSVNDMKYKYIFNIYIYIYI